MLGLGRQSQGMSTALAVEKTSKRGGKIINVAAERGMHTVYSHAPCEVHNPLYFLVLEQQLAEEKKKAQSLTDVMRKPTKVVLLKVCPALHIHTQNTFIVLLSKFHYLLFIYCGFCFSKMSYMYM